MKDEIETTIHTEDGVRVYVSEWDEGGAWLRISAQHGAMSTALTRDEAESLVAGLLSILKSELRI